MNSDNLDAVFSALADPTRRKILESVREKGSNVADLATHFHISLPAISRHLKVLDKAGMINRDKAGKFIMCTYNPKPCREAMKWINEQQQFWNESMNGLADYLNKNA